MNSIFRIRRSWPKLKNSWIDILYFAKPIYVDFLSLFRYFSVSNCFLSPVLSNTTNYEDRKFKKSEYCEKPDVKTRSPCKEGFSSFPSLRPALKTFFGGPENELLQIWVCHCMAGNSPPSMYISVISVVCRTPWIHKFRLNQLFS